MPVHLTEFARDPLNPIRESHIPTLIAAECVHVFDAETDEEVARAAEDCSERAAPYSQPVRPRWRKRSPPGSTCPAVVAAPFPKARALPGGQRQSASAFARQAAGDGVRYRLDHRQRQGGPGIGQKVRTLVDSFEALIVFGGDTAFEILQALECNVLRPMGEIVPGVPVSRRIAMEIAN